MARGIGACDAVIRSRIAGLDPAIHREQRLLSCEDRWMPGSSPLHPIFGSAGPAEHTRPPRQGFEAIAPSRRAARGQQRSPPIMKAIVVTDQAAGTAGMKLVERPEPQAAINDVVVQVHASGFTW